MGTSNSKEEQWKLGYPNGYGKSRETVNMSVTTEPVVTNNPAGANGLAVTSEFASSSGENTAENLWANIALPDVNRPAFLMLPNAKHLIESRKCTRCKKDINPAEFVVDTWLDEYKISGMCVICQNNSFGPNQSVSDIVDEVENLETEDSVSYNEEKDECEICGNCDCSCEKTPFAAGPCPKRATINCKKCGVRLAILNKSNKIVHSDGPCFCYSDPFYRMRKEEQDAERMVKKHEHDLLIKTAQGVLSRQRIPPPKVIFQ
tara:strand:- start:2435 stop:3217 length:783 start_codon:yes stop_codon:yes gene_type:complete